MKILMKILNVINYFAHLENHRITGKYEPYDFTKDYGYKKEKK